MSNRLVRAALLPMVAAIVGGAPAISDADANHAIYNSIRISPDSIFLTDGRDGQRFLVTAECADGSTRDVTSRSRLVMAETEFARLEGNQVFSLADGATTLLAHVDGLEASITVTVANAGWYPDLSFR